MGDTPVDQCPSLPPGASYLDANGNTVVCPEYQGTNAAAAVAMQMAADANSAAALMAGLTPTPKPPVQSSQTQTLMYVGLAVIGLLIVASAVRR